MSHLPLDARAILQHLNELGHRNISAEQLREFLKGMQPQSDNQSAIKSKLASTRANPTQHQHQHKQHQQQQQPQPEQTQQQQPQQRTKVKVIKSKRPLCHFRFYLDICDHQLAKRIEADIKALGGALEFFLNDSITHFITDKDQNASSSSVVPAVVGTSTQPQPYSRSSRPGTPLTPATPGTPLTPNAGAIHEDGSGLPRKSRQTRADTILSRVRDAAQQNTRSQSPILDTNPSQQQNQKQKQLCGKIQGGTYTTWQTDYALRFIRRIQTELRQYLQPGGATDGSPKNRGGGTTNIQLKGDFIKIESIKLNHRPYYHLLKQPEEWPKIDLSSEDGAFRLHAKADVVQSMTRKSLGSRTSQRQQQEKHKESQQSIVVPLQHATIQAFKKQSASIQTPDSPRSHCPKDPKESSDKQCGVCEICKIEYDTLAIHLQSKEHELFAKNASNFLELDALIHESASLSSFLEREAQLEQEQQQAEAQIHDTKQTQADNDMEVDELGESAAVALTLKTINTNNQHQTESQQQNNNNNANSSGNSNNNNNNNNRQRPSPVLREKSKRITKGKHSSEKFHASPNSSPSNNPQIPSTPHNNKKATTPSSLVELQRMELTASNATATAATPTNSTRRKTNNSVLSPPIRAMLPPSSLYKVVEASDAMATPPRMRRGANNAATAAGGGGNAVDSPSLIVKFQKVRQSELQRLNGEAENFMFPRTTTRSSSEMLTDVDRQTTSDVRGHHSISSSIDSTSELDAFGSSTPASAVAAAAASNVQRRAKAVGRRRKGAGAGAAGVAVAPPQLMRQLSTGSSSSTGSGQQQQQQQRFPSAPIQPEMPTQLSKSPGRQMTGTRKSSRTATAIVTAATTSSQLQLRRQTQSALKSRRSGKLEDRMGDDRTSTTKPIHIKQEPIEIKEQEQEEAEHNNEHDEGGGEEDEDEETNEEEETSCSSGSDEDYVATTKLKKVKPTAKRVDTREERAARRLSRLTINLNRSAIEEEQKPQPVSIVTPKSEKSSSPNRRSTKSQKLNAAKTKQGKATGGTSGATASSPPTEVIFDCSKSERLQKMRYAFEEVPKADLWHQVFQRQDAGEEHYYTYYGSTRYRKLPYEMGPIPMVRTKSHSCMLCQKQPEQRQQHQLQSEHVVEAKPKMHQMRPIKVEPDQDTTEQNAQQSDSNQTAATTTTTATTNTTCSMYKHKKVHLLQRYQQEQQQQQQSLNITLPIAKCDSKASTPELLERDFAPLSERAQLVERVRAASTQSSTSSSCSNSQKSSTATSRNKHLARIVDLPPRKSPREHASTLALVSCIIRQRQDSQSKTNSEAEEPPLTPTPTVTPMPSLANKVKKPLKQEPPDATTVTKTRSQAATPVEELRFATEISETVKRMRRGQNKYDSLPQAPPPASAPAVGAADTPTRTAAPTRCRRPNASSSTTVPPVSYSRRVEYARREVNSNVGQLLGKRKRRQMPIKTVGRPPQQQPPGVTLSAGIRKLPSKKGILEYEMEKSALKKLDASLQEYVNPIVIAWQIDKYLELTGQDYDLPLGDPLEPNNVDLRLDAHTPPPTDCFTSEFDLCDLLAASGASGDDEDLYGRTGCRRNSKLNLFSSNQRKRKCHKSNRTGWPRTQRRRTTGVATNTRSLAEERNNCDEVNRPTKLDVRHVKQEPLETEEEQTTTTTTTTAGDKDANKEEQPEDDDDNDEDEDGTAENVADAEVPDKEQTTHEDVVMTPPATDVDEQLGNNEDESGDEAVAAPEAAEADLEESQGEDDDDETMADSVDDQQQNDEAEIEATDADVEEDDAEDDEEDVYEDAFELPTRQDETQAAAEEEEPPIKRERLTNYESSAKVAKDDHSPAKDVLHTSNGYCLNVTSTPSTRQPRRTPQLNGSLGSCISPSEKLGDNSDIFTVSSDGLETDLDLSNTQAGDSMEHCQHHTTTTTTSSTTATPKRKFDISKYAPPNNGKAASSCAAEAATAAVKSLAISQFLKKEVRVTCRRLRAPFRRFRYRR